jgi:hypothetical protein
MMGVWTVLNKGARRRSNMLPGANNHVHTTTHAHRMPIQTRPLWRAPSAGHGPWVM